MIDPRELRIGNLICHEDEGEIVEGIHYIDDNLYKILIGNYLRPISEIKSIPLTEEWLLKFGFEKEEVEAKGIAIWNEWYIGDLEINSTGTEAGCENDFYYKTTDRKVKYVHQLQNLYFSLTGE